MLGIMAPERLSILHAASQTVKLKCFHNNITPAAGSFASATCQENKIRQDKISMEISWQENQTPTHEHFQSMNIYCPTRMGPGNT